MALLTYCNTGSHISATPDGGFYLLRAASDASNRAATSVTIYVSVFPACCHTQQLRAEVCVHPCSFGPLSVHIPWFIRLNPRRGARETLLYSSHDTRILLTFRLNCVHTKNCVGSNYCLCVCTYVCLFLCCVFMFLWAYA